MKRVILIVLDSLGVGALPDANLYNDIGSNTLGHIAQTVEGFSLPNLEKMGIGFIDGVTQLNNNLTPTGSFGRLAEKSPGKDTTTGHWEIAGLQLENPFPLFHNGFPSEVIKLFEERIGTKTLGNFASSGTQIITDLGDEHVKTGYPIVYTSADSVFQIAAHEEIINLKRQYQICEIARELLTGEYAVGRVIARPFSGKSPDYKRTDNRRDFSLKPTTKTMLNYLEDSGKRVKAVGKIEDIYSGSGITDSVHIHGNNDGVDKTLQYMKDDFEGLIFTNLVDFDMLYGHRNDVSGYAKALHDFDSRIPEIINLLKDDDILMITADHGCDPTFPGTDHTREYIPLIIYGKSIKAGQNLNTRESFADIAVTIMDYFQLDHSLRGKSFLNIIKERN